MEPFIQYIDTTEQEPCSTKERIGYYLALPDDKKAIYLLRQAFAVCYARFMSKTEFDNLFDSYISWIRSEVVRIKASHKIPTPDNLVLNSILWTVDKLTKSSPIISVASCHDIELKGRLDADLGLPCRLSKAVWEPFLYYCKGVCKINNYSDAPVTIPASITGKLAYPRYKDRNITLIVNDFSTTVTLDIVADKVLFESENVFSYMCCFNWTGKTAEYLLGFLAQCSLPCWKKSIMHYIRDCVFYTSRNCSPDRKLDDYDIGDGNVRSFLRFLLLVQTRSHVEFQQSELVARLLLVDRTGNIIKDLAREYALSSDATIALTRSTEGLAASGYEWLKQRLLHAQKDTQEPVDTTDDNISDPDQTSKEPEQNPQQSDDESDTTPIESNTPASESPEDSDVVDSSTTADDQPQALMKIGSLTITGAEAPSFQGTMIRERVKAYIDQLLDLNPSELTASELLLLKTLRMQWLYLFSVPSIMDLINLVMAQKPTNLKLHLQ